MKLKTLDQFESKDPCECGGNCGCGGNKSVVNEKFFRMSKETIEKELYAANQALTTYYDWLKAGNDSGRGESLDHIMNLLKKCKDDIKKFNKKEEVEGTVYESVVTEAKKYKFKDLSKAWEFVYGEDMEDEYEGFYQEVTGKYKNKVTKADVADIWQKVYGEDIESEYGGFFNDLKENLNEANKLEEFNSLNEANADGTISDDEDEKRAELLKRVKAQMEELLASAEFDAKDIGGSFRSPGIMYDIRKELDKQVKKFK